MSFSTNVKILDLDRYPNSYNLISIPLDLSFFSMFSFSSLTYFCALSFNSTDKSSSKPSIPFNSSMDVFEISSIEEYPSATIR